MKVTRRKDIHVEVYARNPGDCGPFRVTGQTHSERDELYLYGEISKAIRRHVDDVGLVQVVWRTVEECGFCGSQWEDAWDTSTPECCAAAVEAYDAVRTKEATP